MLTTIVFGSLKNSDLFFECCNILSIPPDKILCIILLVIVYSKVSCSYNDQTHFHGLFIFVRILYKYSILFLDTKSHFSSLGERTSNWLVVPIDFGILFLKFFIVYSSHVCLRNLALTLWSLHTDGLTGCYIGRTM